MRYFCFALFAAAVVAQSCPDLTLPWGIYKPTLDTINDICVYSNIRFASPPLGSLRFQAPEYPPKSSSPTPPDNPTCIQANATQCLGTIPFDNAPSCFGDYYGKQSEDCLFLDIDVPRQALRLNSSIPVVVWFYGGAYLYGSKTQYDPSKLPFYDGGVLVDTATKANKKQNSIIFVRGNYRLGAYGWLAGPYMERNGRPNAGLLDQRAILQFVHDHIAKVKGDPNTVSVWGESAGASSIMHHLAMPQNLEQPLFRRAILQSPAYQWLWDQNDLNKTYTDFATKSGCANGEMSCLQSRDAQVLREVNQDFFQKEACKGVMPLGPSVDGKTILTLAPNSFKGNKIIPLDTVAISHVDTEVPYPEKLLGESFIPLPIRKSPHNETAFQEFLAEVFTGDAYRNVRGEISKRYPISSYKDQVARAARVITDSSFTCNTRYIIDTYLSAGNTKVYAMDYAVFTSSGGSQHASDLLPLFSVSSLSYASLFECILKASSWFPGTKGEIAASVIQNGIAPGMQRYFTDHAVYGDPNHNVGSEYHWLQATRKACPKAEAGTCVWNLMKPDAYTFKSDFNNNKGADTQTPSTVCDFWTSIAQEIARLSGQDTGGKLGGFADQLVLNKEL